VKAFAVALAALTLSAAPAAARSVFDGSWKVDTSSLDFPKAPEVILLDRGIYMSGPVDAPSHVRADGRFHTEAGGDYIDAVSITVIDRHHLREVARLHGKIVYITDYAISADSRTLTSRTSDLGKPDGKPVISETIRRRVGRAARGAHAISGHWQKVKITVQSTSYLTWQLRLEGHRFSNRSSNGRGYDAIVGGPPVAVAGDGAHSLASVTMPNRHTVVQSLSLDGVVGSVMTMVVSPDGKRMKATARAETQGTTTSFMLYRQ
jgi:hypothetical protein